MRKICKSEIVCDEWIDSLISKRWAGGYRYFSSIALTVNDFEIYKEWFEKCESLGLEYALGYIETGEIYKILWGFSMFEILPMGKGVAVSHAFERENESEIIREMAKEKFAKSNFLIFSDEIHKCHMKKSEEEWNEILDIINGN